MTSSIVDADSSNVDSSLRIDATEGSATVSGMVGGQPFVARGAFGLFIQPDLSTMLIALPVNYNVTCDFLQSHDNNGIVLFANQTELVITLQSGPAVMPGGTYRVPINDSGGATMTAWADYTAIDGDCGNPSRESASSGSVTIFELGAGDASALDGGATVSGTFDLTFSNADRLTGQFSAPVCVGGMAMSWIGPPPTICVP
jgi:hypothetical protein